jgi:hypothetical protein
VLALAPSTEEAEITVVDNILKHANSIMIDR